jgi:hypothetical protein
LSALLEKIRSKGHWEVVIRPNKFNKLKLPDISALYPLLQKISVQLRGWDFPHLDWKTPPHIDIDWIGQECDYEDILEIWRFYQSSQFVHISGIRYDWIDPQLLPHWKFNNPPLPVLGIGDTLFRLTEIFEFASRLALTEAGDEQMHLQIVLKGLRGRSLWIDGKNRMPFVQPHTSEIDKFPYSIQVSKTKLIAEPRDLAIEAAIELFRRFGWNPTPEQLRGQQSELKR